MTYKDKLIELLKTDSDIKNTMEKLEFGCKLRFGIEYCSIISKFNSYNVLFHTDGLIGFIEKEEFKKYEIIGLPLQERFIRMYLENKNTSGEFCGNNLVIIIKTKEVIGVNTIKLDNTKDFDNQSEEVYEKIYLALKELTNE